MPSSPPAGATSGQGSASCTTVTRAAVARHRLQLKPRSKRTDDDRRGHPADRVVSTHAAAKLPGAERSQASRVAVVSRRAKIRVFSGQPASRPAVPGGHFAQQRSQLGDVRFFDPAGAVPAVQVAAGLIGVAFMDLAAGIYRDLPGLLRDGADRGLLPRAQLPADRVDDLAAGPRGQLVQPGDQVMAGPEPSQR
jgi:hypothetical protein